MLPYHNPEHNFEVCSVIEKLLGYYNLLPVVQQELYLSAWWHDSIYVPGASDNEEKSADRFEDCMADIVPEDMRKNVRRLILLTKTHLPEWNDTMGRILCDADLVGLGEKYTYKNNAEKIRREFNIWGNISTEVYNEGRKQWLQSFLARDTIYHTSYMRDMYEKQARINLKEELRQLENI